MHLRRQLFAFLGVVLILIAPLALARSPSSPRARASAPVPAHGRVLSKSTAGWASSWRDMVMSSIFGVHVQDKPSTTHAGPRRTSGKRRRPSPPANIRSRFSGDVVLRFTVKTAEEAKALVEASNILFLDVWGATKDWVDIRLTKDMVPSLVGLLPKSLHNAHRPLVHDLAQAIEDSYGSGNVDRFSSRGTQPMDSQRPQSIATDNIFFQDYQPMSVIVPWMKLLTSLFPTHVRFTTIGKTSEGIDIPALRLGVHPTNSQQDTTPRKTIVVVGGSHAREWIGVSTVNYVAYHLITSYGKDEVITKLFEKFDWVFVPVLNVDGYDYTWSTDRLWRKNRQKTALGFCPGVDIDRSFGFKWDGEYAKGNPCSEGFPGDSPFQAVEADALAQWARTENEGNSTFVGFLDLHSYSQQILYPYSYSCREYPPWLEDLEELGMGLAKAIRLTSGEHYEVESACVGTTTPGWTKSSRIIHERLETGGGSALDWFYHDLGVKYSFQLKLRDMGSYGFLLPSSNIVPTGDEAVAAIRYFGEFVSGMLDHKKSRKEDLNEPVSQPDLRRR